MKKKLWLLSAIIAILVFAALAVYISILIIDRYNLIEPDTEPSDTEPADSSVNNTNTDDVSDDVSSTLPDDETSVDVTHETEAPWEPVEVPVDFQALFDVNPDVYAWIKIPGTNIDYPVLQREGDNAYYLNHDWEGKKSTGGAIFSEDYNTKSFTDANIVLYGHKTSKKTMFYALQDLASDVIFEDVRYIYIYMPTRILKYGIFAAFPFRDSHILLTVNFRFEHDFNKFFDDVLSIVDTRANYREEYFPRFGEDKILTLSTCLRENRLKRYIVMAVLLSVEGEPLEDGTVGVIDRSNK